MSLLPIVEAVDNFKPTALSSQKFLPFYLSLDSTGPQDIVGQVTPEVAEKIISYPAGTFAIQLIDNVGISSKSPDDASPPSTTHIKAIAFDERLRAVDERSEAIERACLKWRDQGFFAGAIGGRQWRNEPYSIYVHPFKNIGLDGEVAFRLERAACELFGFVTYGVHMTMYTSDYRIWVPRRSKTKQTWPGFLDNSVAGGIPVGISPFESMIKECEEEASLAEDVARKHVKGVGAVSYFFQNSRGNLQPEVEYVYDMLCPSANDPAFVPKPLDGEVESFELMNCEPVIEKMKAGEFKRNSALGSIDVTARSSWGSHLILFFVCHHSTLHHSTALKGSLIVVICNSNMPPRRAKKPVDTQPSSSDSEVEAPTKSLASKVTSKLRSIVGLETNDTKSATGTKKRKRTNAATEHREEDEEDEEPTPKRGSPRKPRTRASQQKTTPPKKSIAKRAKVLATRTRTTREDSESSESEDELATAPVSPVKPKPKGKAKATATRPQKPVSGRAHKSTTNNTRRKSGTTSTRKSKVQDEYDSSVRELSHSSNSPTPSETSDTRGSADYDPEIEDAQKSRDEDEVEEAALEIMEVDSDALDDESDFGPHKIAERASVSPTKKRATPSSKAGKSRKSEAATSTRKSVGKRAKKEETSEDEYQSDESGPIVVGKVVQAPETGRVPPGQISQNTFDFLSNLQDPEKNDREWFKLHEPVYRLAEKEWVAFVDAWVTTLVEVDDQIPPLPPKDVIHRIYRDMRFSNDKTPYKSHFSASTSRSGRKGIFAAYHISIKPGGGSLVAAGVWCPGKNELQTIRNVIQRNHGRRLREILAEPSFVKYFGKPKPLATKGKELKRQSIFGAEDELKVAPVGVKKDHPDIDLLKCRSFAVVHRFTDTQVLKEDFLENILKPVLVEMRPFVHCLNDYMTLPLDGTSDSSSSSDEE
ncbi:Thiamine pyrophosphokinase [Rhizoctonia solani]|uniref:Thiamine pyrophosphokinase n=1 Tax=Rhizoctonia solani TaxID=456999 RepID=A0A0K6FUF9_9AGAM|nr:Thiamine pyrophosphokinase [Rhizoctonia solani]